MTALWRPGRQYGVAEGAAGAEAPRAALVTVDLQLARAPGACPVAMRTALLERLAEFREAGLPIVHALGDRSPGGGSGPGWEDVDGGFFPRPGARLYGQWLERGRIQRLSAGEVALYKPGWGAFYRTALEDYLRGLGAETVLIAGCGFPRGPRATLYEASERGFATALLADAVSGLYTLARTEVEGLGVSLLRRRAPAAAAAAA